MKQLYLFWLSALLLLGVSTQAQAADPICTVKWNIEGGMELYNALPSAYNVNSLIKTPLEGTSYEITATGWKYFFPAEGYVITNVTSTSSTAVTIKSCSYNGVKYIGWFVSSSYQGSEVNVTLTKISDIQLDKTLTLKIENGIDKLDEIYLPDTNRKFEIKKGEQKVNFATLLDTKLYIVLKNSSTEVFSVTNNGADVSSTKKSYNNYYEIPLTDDSNIVFRGYENDADEPVPDLAEITLKGDIPANFITSVMDGIQRQTITDNKLSIEKGHTLKFNFNATEKNFVLTCGDYTLTVQNGQVTESPETETHASASVNALSGDTNILWTWTFNENTELSFSFTERQYPTIDLFVTIDHPEGITLRKGTIDGEIIDLSTLSHTGNKYTIPVSSRQPKVFYEEKDGWWVRYATYQSPDGTDFAGVISESINDVKITMHKIEKTSKFTIFLGGEPANARFRDGQSTFYTLKKGYNEFEFDPIYNAGSDGVKNTNGYSAMFQNVTSGFSVKLNGSNVSASSDSEVAFPITSIPADALVEIFPVPADYKNIEVAIDDNTTKAVYHRSQTLVNTNKSLRAIIGSEIEITPREGCVVKVNGQTLEAPATTRAALAAQSHVITVDANTTSIAVTYEGNATTAVTTPANGETTGSLSEIKITFPNATSAELGDLGVDEISFRTTDNQWAPTPDQMSISKEENAEKPTFILKLDPAPTALKTYALAITQGFFTIDGDLQSKEITATFTLDKEVSTDCTFDPADITTTDQSTNPYGTFIFEEGTTVTVADVTKITVKVDDTTLTFTDDYSKWGEDGYFTCQAEENMFMVSAIGQNLTGKAATIEVILEAGALEISGKASPAMSHTWKFVEPKEYTYTLTPAASETTAYNKLGEFIITFDNAESAELNETIVAAPKLSETGYESGRYIGEGVITKVAGAEHPTFKITFTPAPAKDATYTLTIQRGKFLLDDTQQWSPEVNENYILDVATSVDEIAAEIEGSAIYSIDGRTITRKADSESIRNLQPGLYIINGKKVIKK